MSGWLARGPTGVIATTMYDAYSVADAIASDLISSPSPPKGGDVRVSDLVGDPSRLVSWRGWERIDREEKRRGEGEGRPRQKITSIDEMLDVASA